MHFRSVKKASSTFSPEDQLTFNWNQVKRRSILLAILPNKLVFLPFLRALSSLTLGEFAGMSPPKKIVVLRQHTRTRQTSKLSKRLLL